MDEKPFPFWLVVLAIIGAVVVLRWIFAAFEYYWYVMIPLAAVGAWFLNDYQDKQKVKRAEAETAKFLAEQEAKRRQG